MKPQSSQRNTLWSPNKAILHLQPLNSGTFQLKFLHFKYIVVSGVFSLIVFK